MTSLPPEIKVTKPTFEDIENASNSPWYKGYMFGRESTYAFIFNRGFFGRLKFLLFRK